MRWLRLRSGRRRPTLEEMAFLMSHRLPLRLLNIAMKFTGKDRQLIGRMSLLSEWYHSIFIRRPTAEFDISNDTLHTE